MRYRPGARKKKEVHCRYCGSDISHKKGNTYCDLECKLSWDWENKEVPKIEAGLGGNIKRYLVEKYGSVCSECGLGTMWNNKPLTLQLDHIDGDSDNNLPSNCRLLCPNCHTQTDTWGAKGAGSRYKKISKRNKYLREYKSSG